MTEQEIIESNKLIAEFMGATFKKDSTSHILPNVRVGLLWLPIHGICRYDTIERGKGKVLRYHISWDWLMPVWKKLQQDVAALGKPLYIEMFNLPEFRKFIEMGLVCADINVAFEELVKLIKRYNENIK